MPRVSLTDRHSVEAEGAASQAPRIAPSCQPNPQGNGSGQHGYVQSGIPQAPSLENSRPAALHGRRGRHVLGNLPSSPGRGAPIEITRWFDDVGLIGVDEVGGNSANPGELHPANGNRSVRGASLSAGWNGWCIAIQGAELPTPADPVKDSAG
jgi:hypothetical protein